MVQPIINKIQNLSDYEKFIEPTKINIKKKDTKGEVFTPIELCIEILDKNIPNSIWHNPNLKWLEPSAGTGNFLVYIFIKLFHGLESWQPNIDKRKKHIIENMLYMVEVDKINCNKLKKIFGSNANIKCDDMLKVSYDFTFDIIIGNPPFQDNYGLTKEGKRILGGKTKLYEKIFVKSFDILKKGGYLIFISPDNIFSGITQSYNLLVNNHVKNITFGLKHYFPSIQQDMCYFILKKGTTGNTEIINTITKNKFITKLILRPVNPIKNWTKHTELLVKKYVSNERNNAIYNRGKNISEYKGSKYELIYTNNENLYTNNKDLAVGLDQPKVIIFFISPNFEFKMDYRGIYGIGPNTFYIPFQTKKEGQALEKFFSSNNYKELAETTKTTRQYIKIALIEYLNLNFIMNKSKLQKTKKKKTTNNKTKKNKT